MRDEESRDVLSPVEPAPASEGVYRKSIKSGSWYMASVFGQKALNLVTFLILARLLVPADYGIIAVVLLVTGLANQLTTISFGDALTQRKDAIDRYLDPVWTFELIRNALLALAIYVSGGWLTDFFHISDPFAPMLRWSGMLLVMGALPNVRQLYLFKQLEFRKLFYRDMIGQVTYSVTAIGFAWFVQASAWALFVGYVAQYAAGILVSYVIYPSRPAISFRFGRLKDLLGFVKWVYGQEILDVILVQIDKIFVGRMLNPVQLGVYAKAKDLASTATMTLASMMQKVGFAAFSQVQDRLDKVQEGFRKTVDVLFLTGVPIALLLLLEGGNIVSLLLGPKWLLIVVPLKIFAFGNLFYTFASMVSPVLAALGRPDILFKMNVLRTILMAPLMYVGITVGGIEGLAWAIVGIWIVTLVYVVLYARPILRIPKRDFYPAFFTGGAACLAVLAADVAVRQFRPIIETGNAAKFIQVAGLGIFYYVVIAFVGRRMKEGPYGTLLSVLREIGLKRFIG